MARINSDQLARRLKVTPRLIRYWRENKTGPKWGRYGARVEYDVADVEAWEREQLAARQGHYNTHELAELLDLSETTIVMWRYHGRGPDYIKRGRFVAYPKNETHEWAERNGYKVNR